MSDRDAPGIRSAGYPSAARASCGSTPNARLIGTRQASRHTPEPEKGVVSRPRYRIEPVDLGHCLLPRLDKTAAVIAFAEGEDHR